MPFKADGSCFRLAQLGLVHSLYYRALVAKVWKNTRNRFESSWKTIMKYPLSPYYKLESCRDRYLWKFHRCITMDDLHPRDDHAVYLRDLALFTRIFASFCSVSCVCLLAEMLPRRVQVDPSRRSLRICKTSLEFKSIFRENRSRCQASCKLLRFLIRLRVSTFPDVSTRVFVNAANFVRSFARAALLVCFSKLRSR